MNETRYFDIIFLNNSFHNKLDQLKEDFWVSAFQNWTSNKVFTTLLIYKNESPVGCVAYGKAREEKFSEWRVIVSIYVLPDYWGKGYSRRL